MRNWLAAYKFVINNLMIASDKMLYQKNLKHTLPVPRVINYLLLPVPCLAHFIAILDKYLCSLKLC